MRVLLPAFCMLIVGHAVADEGSARSCTSIRDKTARLACYDAAFGVSPAAAPPPVPPAAIASPAMTSPAVADDFGDNGRLKSSPKKPQLPKQLSATVASVATLPRGLFRLTLDNGQVWETTQADWTIDFKSNSNVNISRMTFGNYLVSIAGQGRSVAVKRVK